MNTKIIVQRLAKVVGAKPETSFAIIKEDRGALHSIKMGVATAVVVASVAPALAYGNATQMGKHAARAALFGVLCVCESSLCLV
jgi:hypothetical protein